MGVRVNFQRMLGKKRFKFFKSKTWWTCAYIHGLIPNAKYPSYTWIYHILIQFEHDANLKHNLQNVVILTLPIHHNQNVGGL
jgi:hypothetical protein